MYLMIGKHNWNKKSNIKNENIYSKYKIQLWQTQV